MKTLVLTLGLISLFAADESYSQPHPGMLLTPQIVSDVKARAVDDEKLRLLIERNETKARAILRDPNFQITRSSLTARLRDNSPIDRFLSRRCLRIMIDSKLAVEFADVRNTLSSDELARLRALPVETLTALSELTQSWYTPFNPKKPSDNTLEIGELTACLAIGYDWFVEDLSEEQRSQVENAIGVALNRYLQAHKSLFIDGNRVTYSNWNAVVSTGAMLAALALRNTTPPAEYTYTEYGSSAVSRVKNLAVGTTGTSLSGKNLIHFVRNKVIGTEEHPGIAGFYSIFGEGGSFPEGPMYFNLSFDYLLLAEEALRTLGLRGLGAGSSKNVRQSGRFMLDLISPISPALNGNPRGTVIMHNFSDAGGTIRPSLGALSWFGSRLRQYDIAVAANALASWPISALDVSTPISSNSNLVDGLSILLYRPTAHAFALNQKSRSYGSADGEANYVILRRRLASGDFLNVTVNGGRATVTGHGQMEAGAFTVDAIGRRWVSDLGRDSYEIPGYFDLKHGRWNTFRANNLGNSTLNIDREVQVPDGKAIATLIQGSAGDTASVDLSAAYSSGERAVSVKRSVTALKSGSLVVTDEIQGVSPGQVVEARLIHCKPSVTQISDVQTFTASDGQQRSCVKAEPAFTPADEAGRILHVSQEPLSFTKCDRKVMTVSVLSDDGTIRWFAADPSLAENIPKGRTSPSGQANNSGCYVIAISAPAHGSTLTLRFSLGFEELRKRP